MANFMKRGNKWQARITWRDSDGKLHQKSRLGFLTKQQARQWAVKMQKEQLDGTDVEKDPTFEEYFSDWFTTYKKSVISDVTARHYYFTAKLIKKYFSGIKLKKMTRSKYQKFINAYGSNHAPETVKKINTIIRACAKSAVLDGIISKDFTAQVNLVANKNNEMHVEYLSLAEIKKLKEFALRGRSRHFTSRYMILTAIYTGARLGEIQALTWKNIDFLHRTIDINKSWDYLHGGKFKPTKNESSNRTIRVNQELLDLLSELRANDSTMVFTDQYHRIPSSNAVNKTLRKIMNAAGLHKRDFHFHSLRHSHVAYLLSQGADLYIISKRLGHADTTVTSKVYAYLVDEYQDKANDQIEKYLQNI